mgnify:CR=1 FL=1
MKKILLIMICSMAAFATSCSLEETPYSITSEKLGQTEEGAEQLVTGIYATFWDNWCMEQTYMAWMDYDNDHCGAPAWVLSSAGSGDITGHYAYNTNNDLWSVFYRMISRANKAKEALESTDSYQTESAVRQLYGNAFSTGIRLFPSGKNVWCRPIEIIFGSRDRLSQSFRRSSLQHNCQ